MRWFALALLLLAGCEAQPAAFPLREECRLGAWLALHVAREAPPLKVPSPDKPDQGDTCEDCGGTGKVGDGTVFVTCGTCNGTGKKPAAAFDTPKETAAFKTAMEAPKVAESPPGPGTWRKVCKDGVCTWEKVK